MLVVDSSVWIDFFNGADVPAAFCIERDYALLHDDRDFDAFETHRGLRVWRH